MSRPANPSWTVGSWATDASYPTTPGMPWSAQPTKVVHPSPAGGFVPGIGDACEWDNWLFHDIYDTLAATKAHATALTTYVGQVPALNLLTTSTSIGDLKSAVFDATNRLWYVVGGNENVRFSNDDGASWSSNSDVATPGAGEDCHGIDVDSSGNVVVATNTRYAFEKTIATSAWTKVDVTGALSGIQSGAVAFDPVRSVWAVLVNTSSGGARIHTSTNRTSWSLSPQEGYGDFASLYAAVQIAANKTNGRLLAVGVQTSTVKSMTSDDGGATWTQRPNLTIGFTAEALFLSHAGGSTWYLVANKTTGGNASEVWKSTDDGATFTKVCTLTASRLGRIAALGELLISTAIVTLPAGIFSEAVFSVDGGVTWRASRHIKGSATAGAYAGDGGVLIVTSLYAYASGRCGLPINTIT